MYYEGDYVESSQELPSPGFRKERRGSSVRGKRPVEQRLSGSGSASGSPSSNHGGGGGGGGGQGAWPPLASGSILAPIDPTGTVAPSPRTLRRRSTKEDLRGDFKEFNSSRAEETPKNDKDCRIM